MHYYLIKKNVKKEIKIIINLKKMKKRIMKRVIVINKELMKLPLFLQQFLRLMTKI
uniref:Uncharacterized protein n=1 Tax=Meloidogyne enterolobii TaxID=390850 RepID=A0A6V7UPE6_MELEN|nr:unnamed protein product [Meloidogyne enterolobii]